MELQRRKCTRNHNVCNIMLAVHENGRKILARRQTWKSSCRKQNAFHAVFRIALAFVLVVLLQQGTGVVAQALRSSRGTATEMQGLRDDGLVSGREHFSAGGAVVAVVLSSDKHDTRGSENLGVVAAENVRRLEQQSAADVAAEDNALHELASRYHELWLNKKHYQREKRRRMFRDTANDRREMLDADNGNIVEQQKSPLVHEKIEESGLGPTYERFNLRGNAGARQT